MIPAHFHCFDESTENISLPRKFTCPFHYTPHPLCVKAVRQLQDYLTKEIQWEEELKQGKMFGVLVVQTDQKELGFVAAFSGNLGGSSQHDYFVPPIYNLSQPQGFFKTEEREISEINAQIVSLENDDVYVKCKEKLAQETADMQQFLAQTKIRMAEEKAKRDVLRSLYPDEATLFAMIRESQHQKANFKRDKEEWNIRITSLRVELQRMDSEIIRLKAERKCRSEALQMELFSKFKILNALGEIKLLPDLFDNEPPSGAGECAAPKLLQYAYLNHLKPIAMAEVWLGCSPKTEIRRNGFYYPACKRKCEPILTYMLQGLDVEPNPLLEKKHQNVELDIVYEDDWLLVVNKLPGMLSVPGKAGSESVSNLLHCSYPEATGPMIVHRLDMDTSGLLLAAKTKEVHQNLQAQFKNHNIQKRYVALLDGEVGISEGTITLSLRPDPDDRPRQMVDDVYGKPAITRYKVLEHRNGETRISFYPLTGRTHQLRVSAACTQGLDAPIKGDALYGTKSDRLYLHAEYIEFTHPVTKKLICVEKKAEF